MLRRLTSCPDPSNVPKSPDWRRRATNPEFITVLALDLGVVLALDDLPAKFHGDPADRLIVSTARAHRLPLATHDRRIRRSRAVKVWRA
ncbi:MAG: PIN domain-containing protein [Vicinamibacterales bacterium]